MRANRHPRRSLVSWARRSSREGRPVAAEAAGTAAAEGAAAAATAVCSTATRRARTRDKTRHGRIGLYLRARAARRLDPLGEPKLRFIVSYGYSAGP